MRKTLKGVSAAGNGQYRRVAFRRSGFLEQLSTAGKGAGETGGKPAYRAYAIIKRGNVADLGGAKDPRADTSERRDNRSLFEPLGSATCLGPGTRPRQ